jgi:hypothetical protein
MKHRLLGLLLALLLPLSMALANDRYPKVTSDDDGGHLNHFEAGAFFNYYRLVNDFGPDTNFYGLGGRIGVNVSHHVQLEAEGAWDPEQNITFSSNGVTLITSPTRVVHFMFGPKFQVGTSGPARFFVTAKGGLINFSQNPNFADQVSGIVGGDTFATFYPGLGFEFFAKFFGVRFEAGDEMFFNGDVNHNPYVMAGPVIRF